VTGKNTIIFIQNENENRKCKKAVKIKLKNKYFKNWFPCKKAIDLYFADVLLCLWKSSLYI